MTTRTILQGDRLGSKESVEEGLACRLGRLGLLLVLLRLDTLLLDYSDSRVSICDSEVTPGTYEAPACGRSSRRGSGGRERPC